MTPADLLPECVYYLPELDSITELEYIGSPVCVTRPRYVFFCVALRRSKTLYEHEVLQLCGTLEAARARQVELVTSKLNEIKGHEAHPVPPAAPEG